MPASTSSARPVASACSVSRSPAAAARSIAVRARDRAVARSCSEEVQVGGHPADHDRLLSVLLAEEGDCRADHVEELCDHGRDAAEVARTPSPRIAAENAGEICSDLDRGIEARWVDLIDAGRPDDVDSGARGQLEVARLIARVGAEVLAGAELRRVHEQAHDDDIAASARFAQQAQVAIVQRAHRRHQPDGRAPGAGRRQRLAQLRPVARHNHPRSSRARDRVRWASSS